jgi:hypothetical protein
MCVMKIRKDYRICPGLQSEHWQQTNLFVFFKLVTMRKKTFTTIHPVSME